MNIVEELFSRYQPVAKKLKAYGFCVQERKLVYEKDIMDDAFKALICVDEEGNTSAKLIDNDLGGEYSNIYSERYGAYVSMVREAFISLLEDIREKCYEKKPFLLKQTERIVSHIRKQYGVKPEYVFRNYPDYAVFRKNGKWFGIVMNINGKKIGLNDKEIEIIDVHLDRSLVASLKSEKGFHEAWHMNKDNWITILLDDSIDDEVIFSLIDASYEKTEVSDAWLVPANPEYYDVIGMFSKSDTTMWKQAKGIHVGDIVYLYVAQPYSSILYQCEVIETDIPYEYKDRNISMSGLMKMRVLRRFPKERYTFAWLRDRGIKMVRGPRRISKEILEQLG